MADGTPDDESSTNRVRALAAAAAAVWRADWDALRRALGALQALGAARADVEETLLQCVLFCGFPRVVTAFGCANEAWPPAAPPRGGGVPDDEQRAAGRALFAAIYGAHADAVEAMLRGCHEDFHAFVFEVAYGRVLARPGLPPVERELLAAALLAAQDQPRQFTSHALGALRMGASRALLQATLAEALGSEAAAAPWLQRLR
jgi:alkylhydroperoxidase/carboxymuconolactone decarboxylase family protein YurZ